MIVPTTAILGEIDKVQCRRTECRLHEAHDDGDRKAPWSAAADAYEEATQYIVSRRNVGGLAASMQGRAASSEAVLSRASHRI